LAHGPGFGRLDFAHLLLLNLLDRLQPPIFRQAIGAAAEAVALQVLDDWMSRPASRRGAISIAFSVSGSSGMPSAAARHAEGDTMVRRALRRFSCP
jgi:hypothetical protein